MVGDIDGDGIPDSIVGAPQSLAAVRPGKTWLLFLQEDGTVRDEVEVAPALGVLGSSDQFGASVASIGNLSGMAGITEVAVGAVGTPGGGAVWILSLDASGAVVDERMLVGTGVLSGDVFGSAVAGLGDLDGDSVPDLAVGARLANDGGVDAGAVWILLLNANGTIKAQTRVSDLVGGFTGAGGDLEAQDNFGASLSSPGDLDADGRSDLFVGAPGDDGLGAVWVLYLNASGTVKATHKLAAVAGVDPGVRFGASVGALGNLDGAGGIEIAVGAPRDDDGATDRGAAWILFLDAAEMTSSSLKISDTAGAFTGDLNGGLFGASVAGLGDLDQDGRIELAVGESAAFAPVAGVGAGAVWILSLVGPTDSVWTGAVSSDWFDAGNWSLGVPNATRAAVVRPNGLVPSIPLNGGADAECLDLALARFASLGLPSAGEPLEVHRNLRSKGTASGTGDLIFSGDGSLVAGLPLNAPVVVATTATVELRGDLALNSGLTLAAGTLEVCEGCEATVVGTADFGVGQLRGTGVLDLDADATFAGTDVDVPPTFHFSGDVTVDAAFAPLSGHAVFDGAAPQTLTETGPGLLAVFHSVQVTPTAKVMVTEGLHTRGGLVLDGQLELNEPLVVEGDMTGSSGSAELRASTSTPGNCTSFREGSVIFPGLIFGNCMFGLQNPSQQSVIINVPQGFSGDLLIDSNGGGDVLLASSTLTVAQNLKILSGTLRPLVDADISAASILVENMGGQPVGRLDSTSHDLGIVGGTPMTVRGELAAGAGGALLLDASPVSIESGGRLELNGATGNPARMAKRTSGRYLLTIQDGGSLDAHEFTFETMDAGGVKVLDTSGQGTIDIADGLFAEVDVNSGVMLEISLFQDRGFDGVAFEDGVVGSPPPGTYNVRVLPGSAVVGLSNWSGDFAGPSFDDPTGVPLWGATLTEFVVREGLQENDFRWRSSAETPEVDSYRLERADLPSGSYQLLVQIPAVGPSLYTYTDATIQLGQRYRYRLSERLIALPQIVDSTLEVRDTNGASDKGHLPGRSPPAPLPLVSSSGTGTVDDLLDALRRTPPGTRRVEWQLAGGRMPAFELEAGSWEGLDLSPVPGEVVVLDASSGPLVLRGLRPGQGVALAGLTVDAGDPARPALVVEGCAGAILLEGLEIRGRLVVWNSGTVLAQESSASALELDAGARADLRGGTIGTAEFAGRSRLESAAVNWLSDPHVERGSKWREISPAPVLLAHPTATGISIEASSGPRQTWMLTASDRLTDVLGTTSGGLSFPLGRAGAGGLLEREYLLPPELQGTLLYLRAAPIDSERGPRTRSNAVRLRPTR